MSQTLAPRDADALRPIRVLVVDDSLVARQLLVHVLAQDARIDVVGEAHDGADAVAAARSLKPDVIVMDIHLPGIDGFAATRQIMETCPTRIVMATATSDPHEVAATFRAIEAGALAVLPKPVGPAHPGFAATAAELVRTVTLMAEVPVVRRWPRPDAATPPPLLPLPIRVEPHDGAAVRLVAVGASTGGPIALQRLLAGLPREFPVPVAIVQHIADGFVEGLAGWLTDSTRFPVRVARQGELLRAGYAYLAPDGCHLEVRADGSAALVDTAREHGVRPSVSVLFRSVAAAFGASAVGVLLTGMGRDGARELAALRQAGAVTIAQDRASSVVHGMPAEAIRLGGAMHVLAPDEIAQALVGLVDRAQRRKP